jgi:hypothetical protein
MRIKDGLTKISKAKVSLLKRNRKMDADTAAQIDTSAKKLDILKHELHKCQVQLTGLYTALAANEKAEAANSNVASSISNLRPQSYVSGDSSSRDDSFKNDNAAGTNEVIKLSILDQATKTEFAKTFVVTREETVRDLISRAIDKFNLEDAVEEYQIMLKTLEDDVPLRLDDLVITDSIDCSQVTWTLVSKLQSAVCYH